MKPSIFSAVAIWLGCLSAAQADISGVYLNASNDHVEMIHLIERPDGTLLGRIESASLDENGKFDTSTIDIEGAVKGDQALFSTTLSIFGIKAASFSATKSKNQLRLSWSDGNQQYFLGSTDQYQIAVAALRDRGKRIRTANANEKADQKFKETFSRYIELSDNFITEATSSQERFAEFSDQIEKTYKRYHNRRRAAQAVWSLGDYDTFDAIDREIMALDDELWRIKNSTEDIVIDLEGQLKAIRYLALGLDKSCQAPTSDHTQLCERFEAKRMAVETTVEASASAYTGYRKAFDAASVDTPPIKKLMKRQKG